VQGERTALLGRVEEALLGRFEELIDLVTAD
jgi:hypothetical protein